MKPPIEYRPKRGANTKPETLAAVAVVVGLPLDTRATDLTPVGRKVYLKLKARERRQRERAEADKLGITVKEYRARKK
jgi:hypothetical protein